MTRLNNLISPRGSRASSSPFCNKHQQNVVNLAESKAEGQGNENSDAVRGLQLKPGNATNILHSGLDNAGKTTIVKRIMNEDVNSISPTLGFIIKTIDYEG